MPRFVITPHARHPKKHERLVKKLVQEFTASSTKVQPLILEELVPSTKSRHVRVIWDAWKDLAHKQRSDVIVDAYAEAEGADAAAEITIAEGVTPHEAFALGLLPYKVVSARKRDDRVSLEDYQSAQATEAQRTLLGGKAKELRYARVEEADEALKRLQQVLPGSSWTIVQEWPIET